MMKKLFYWLVFALFASPLFAQSNPLNSAYKPSIDTTCTDSQYASNIWMTNTMQKIVQTNTTAATNACYITIYATQGEFGDFQVHVVSPGGGYAGITVASSSFVCSTGPTCASPFTIPAPSTSNNNIVVWREFYETVSTLTTSRPVRQPTTGQPEPIQMV